MKRWMSGMAALFCAIACVGCSKTTAGEGAPTTASSAASSVTTTTTKAPIVDTGTIVGKWENSVNLAGGLCSAFMNEQVQYYYDGRSIDFVMTVTFDEDGRYTSELNVEASRDAYDRFIEMWCEMTEEYYAELIEYNQIDVSVDQMVADFEDHYGMSMAELYRKQAPLEQLANSLKVEDTYRVDGTKLYRGKDESVYETYLLESGALYIVSSSDPNLSEDDKAGYPYKFVRVG